MAVSTLQTRIALLCRTYESWTTTNWKNYVPLKGEVCFCEIPASAGIVADEPCVLFKVGNGVMDPDTGGVTGTAFKDLKWSSAKAADVYSWAKKENLEFSDFSSDLKSSLLNYIQEEIQPALYRLINPDNEPYVWQLQKSTDGGKTWVNVSGYINLKSLEGRVTELESKVSVLEAASEVMAGNIEELQEKVSDYGGAMTSEEIHSIIDK